MAKSKNSAKSADVSPIASIKPYLPHVLFALAGLWLVLSGISLVDLYYKALAVGYANMDKVWGYGQIVFGSMLIGGALAQGALIKARKNG